MDCKVTIDKALVELMTLTITPIIILVLATGCTLLTVPQKGYTPENRQALDKLLSKNKYQQAQTYLDKMQLDAKGSTYKSQQRRITRLMENFEHEVLKKTTDLTVQGDYAEAIELIDQTLDNIPNSSKLINLSDSLKKARDERLLVTRHNLLLSEAEHLISQLEWHEERTLLKKPSFFSRWRIKRMKELLDSLHPELIGCAKQAIAANHGDIAERCLHTAAMIDNSTMINQMLGQITSNEEGSSLVPISEENKTRPASATAPSFLAMEEKLKNEIEDESLLKAYETLAKLASFPGKEKALNNYRQVLDNMKSKKIASLMQDGAALYRNGKIGQARGEWRKVLELDPNNHTANEKIIRADKVLKKIEDLQKSQKPPTD